MTENIRSSVSSHGGGDCPSHFVSVNLKTKKPLNAWVCQYFTEYRPEMDNEKHAKIITVRLLGNLQKLEEKQTNGKANKSNS